MPFQGEVNQHYLCIELTPHREYTSALIVPGKMSIGSNVPADKF